MGKLPWCRWQWLVGGALALVCLSCQPSMPPAPRPALPPPPAAAPEPPPQRETLYVKVGRLNLRAGPGMDFPKLGLLERNEEVEHVGEAQNWFQVRVKKDGTLGWVASEYLSKTPVASPLEPPAPGFPPAPAVKETPPPAEPAKPKPPKPVETTVPRAPKPAEAAEPPAPKAKPSEGPAPAPAPEPKAKPEKPTPKKEEPVIPPAPPPPPEERPSGIRIM